MLNARRTQAGKSVLINRSLPGEEFLDGQRVSRTRFLKGQKAATNRGHHLCLAEACARYTLTVEEFLSWQASIDQHGLAGLRTTRIQQYRQ